MRFDAWAIVGAACVALLAAAVPLRAQGVAVEGVDQTRVLPPRGAEVAPYENAGYRLWLEDGEARIEVRTAPLGSLARFEPPEPTAAPSGGVERLARAQTLGAKTQYEAASEIFDWVARHIEYRLERQEDQSAAAVLERRSGYCTGIARLTVALLRSVGLESREVAGYVLGGRTSGERQGYHRWVETRFDDVGWVFSDPLSSHHFVPATYMRLDSEKLRPEQGTEGLLIERQDALSVVDLYPMGTAGVRGRRNSDRQIAASVRVSVDSPVSGMAVLETADRRWRHALISGEATFIGLPAGDYQLRLMIAGTLLERVLRLGGRERTTLFLSLPDRRASRLRSGAGSAMNRTHPRWSSRR